MKKKNNKKKKKQMHAKYVQLQPTNVHSQVSFGTITIFFQNHHATSATESKFPCLTATKNLLGNVCTLAKAT